MKSKSVGFVGLLLLVGWIVRELEPPTFPTAAARPPTDAVGPCEELARAFASILPALDQDVFLATHFVVDGEIVGINGVLERSSTDAWIVGITNLPDGTPLDVRGGKSGTTRALGRAVTRRGCFELPIRNVDPDVLAQLDQVEVTTGCLDEAAPAFQRVLGETRGHLRGHAVQHEPCLSVRKATPVRSQGVGARLALFDEVAVDELPAEEDAPVVPARRAILGPTTRHAIARLLARGRALGELRRQHHAGDLDALVACNEERVRLDAEVGGLLGSGDPLVARELMRFHRSLLNCTSCDAARGDAACEEAEAMLRAERERAVARGRARRGRSAGVD